MSATFSRPWADLGQGFKTASKIGYAYQICYVKLFNRLPPQSPLEILEELATFVAIQADIPKDQLYISDFSVVVFRSDFVLFSEKNYMKAHRNQWVWTMPCPPERLAGATR